MESSDQSKGLLEELTKVSSGVKGISVGMSIPHKRPNWNPQPDITAYELARCLPVLLMLAQPGVIYGYVGSVISSLPMECQRHWKE